MPTLFLENEYSISLASSYFVDTPILKEDWLCICLYYDSLITMLKPNVKFNQDLINFEEYPLLELVKSNYTGKPLTDPSEINLNSIRFATENNYHFLPNLESIERDDFITFVNSYLPASIPNLKKSFLTFDILKHFIIKNIPSLGGRIDIELESKLIEFKKSELGNAFITGVEETIQNYSSYYYVTPELEQQLKNEFIETQQEFLGKLDFEKIKKFKLSSLIEDGIGSMAGLVIPFLPLGTIKEIFIYTKTQLDFKKNKRLQFILSIFYLQKILQQTLQSSSKINDCVICQTTEAEILNLKEENVDDFIFKNTPNMCLKHMISYLNARKFGGLTGKPLLVSLKKL